MAHDMFKPRLSELIHHAPDDETKAELQAVFDRLYGGGAHTDSGGHTTGSGDPPGS